MMDRFEYLKPGVAAILVFVGFMLFNLMTNLGPNSMTYLIAGEVFPTALRGTGAGFAASVAKIGAVLTAFLFPILLASWGTAVIVLLLAGTSLLGALITWLNRVETNGMSLEQIDAMHDVAADDAEPVDATR